MLLGKNGYICKALGVGARPDRVHETSKTMNSNDIDNELDDHDDGKSPAGYEGATWQRLLCEIGRMLLVLLGRLAKVLLRLTLRLLRLLLKYTIKGIILLCVFAHWSAVQLCRLTKEGLRQAKIFWNDNDTQAKVRKARQMSRAALRTLGRWCVVAASATMKGAVWTGKKIIEGIVNMGPALQRLCRGIGRWWRGRRVAYIRFRHNRGFKGLFIDLGNALARHLQNYMSEEDDEEEEAEKDEVAATEEVVVEEETEPNERSLWQKCYDAVKRIVEDE